MSDDEVVVLNNYENPHDSEDDKSRELKHGEHNEEEMEEVEESKKKEKDSIILANTDDEPFDIVDCFRNNLDKLEQKANPTQIGDVTWMSQITLLFHGLSSMLEMAEYDYMIQAGTYPHLNMRDNYIIGELLQMIHQEGTLYNIVLSILEMSR